ncbi:MAG TPA: hypothetical protein ENJ33_02635 [Thiothrix sp.]|nr:hypothetical protein [Thiothrix sp.]
MSSCTLNEGDPQTTLCQKLTAHLMTAEKVKWNKVIKVPTPGEHLQITVSFNNADGSVTEATCTYGLNDRDEGEDYEVTPDEFVNIPDIMVINGEEVRLQDLHTSIQKVTGQAVKDTFNEEHLTKKADEVTDAVKGGTIKITKSAEKMAEQAKEAAVSATESLKKGAEHAKDTAGKVAEQLKETRKDLQHKAGEALEKAGEKLQE